MSKILIVIDMQNDFITGALGSDGARAVVPNAARKIREFDGEIFYTMDTHSADYLQTQEGRKLPVVHCVHGTQGWELHPEIRDALGGRGRRYLKCGFGSSELTDDLSSRADARSASIEIIGVCTDICVITNALTLKTFLPEAGITVDASCCAGVTPQSHDTALKAMRACQIEIVGG